VTRRYVVNTLVGAVGSSARDVVASSIDVLMYGYINQLAFETLVSLGYRMGTSRLLLPIKYLLNPP
jgi:hypothetical protein